MSCGEKQSHSCSARWPWQGERLFKSALGVCCGPLCSPWLSLLYQIHGTRASGEQSKEHWSLPGSTIVNQAV